MGALRVVNLGEKPANAPALDQRNRARQRSGGQRRTGAPVITELRDVAQGRGERRIGLGSLAKESVDPLAGGQHGGEEKMRVGGGAHGDCRWRGPGRMNSVECRKAQPDQAVVAGGNHRDEPHARGVLHSVGAKIAGGVTAFPAVVSQGSIPRGGADRQGHNVHAVAQRVFQGFHQDLGGGCVINPGCAKNFIASQVRLGRDTHDGACGPSIANTGRDHGDRRAMPRMIFG